MGGEEALQRALRQARAVADGALPTPSLSDFGRNMAEAIIQAELRGYDDGYDYGYDVGYLAGVEAAGGRCD